MIPSSQAPRTSVKEWSRRSRSCGRLVPRMLDAKYPFQILRRQSGDDQARAVLASAFLR